MADPNWKNRTLFHGDNLRFLRTMNSESVDLIATDPPFKKGRDFHATPDSLASGASFQDRWSWEKDVHREWVDQIKDDYPAVWEVIDAANAIYGHTTKKARSRPREEVGSDMGAFLCFMAVRLLEMRRVLKPTGGLYLHCDPTASHYLKELLDAVFGWQHFRNEIVWAFTGRLMAGTRAFNTKHNILLFYAKTSQHLINPVTEPIKRDEYVTMKKQKVHTDEEGREWIWGHAGKGKSHEYRIYLDDVVAKGKALNTVWPFPIVNTSAKERYGYPTQKPLALYERIIKASSNEGDMVVDPFCGCATTLIAAERLGRQWAGIDIWNKAQDAVIDRLRKEDLLAPDGNPDKLFHVGEIRYATEPPPRTDDGQEAVPFLKTKLKVDEPKGPKMSRAEMVAFLLEQHGSRCQGCNRLFDDPRYLELDHNTPRSDGGLNHISNRILLCGPCNKLKSNRFTLSGLRRENKKLGWMARP